MNAHLIEAVGADIRSLDAIGVVAEVSCRYFEEIGFPAPVDLGLVVDRIGRSSVSYRVGLFQGEGQEANAEGRFVHVYVDNTVTGRRPSVRSPSASAKRSFRPSARPTRRADPGTPGVWLSGAAGC